MIPARGGLRSPYLALFRIRFTHSLQYRAAALAGFATQFAWGFMYILAFIAFYESNPHSFPMTLPQTVSYIWLQQAFMSFFFIWFYDNSIFSAVESGEIAYELARPMDLYARWFSQTSANRLAAGALRCLPLLVVAIVIPAPFRLVLPTEGTRILLFFASMFLAMGVVVSLTMLVYISAFSTINSMGTRIVVGVAADFLAGGYLPIPFFPDVLRFAVELSPFGAMQNMPLRIFSGHLYGEAMMQGLALQVFWLFALLLIGRILMKRALRRVVVQGG
ncbi:MAG: ABC transporter permease [Defluviitaleaceae bacterium]|nr:ABC transporter permease [Defluviitaleaceae bacterium]MCL2273339.1 ABC transporter permease [Defluviitaleaceae bacterium]